jgi:hypothetical protein
MVVLSRTGPWPGFLLGSRSGLSSPEVQFTTKVTKESDEGIDEETCFAAIGLIREATGEPHPSS